MQFLNWLFRPREVTGFADFPNTPLPELEFDMAAKDMMITVDRYLSNRDATLSKVYIDGEYQCDGLEDGFRSKKVMHETRIPAGRYKVGLRTVGGFHSRYASKFPDFHKGMLHVLDVPGFEFILLHIGNYHTDTSGCLLLGAADESQMTVWISRSAYTHFYKKVIGAALDGRLWIEYRDSDRV